MRLSPLLLLVCIAITLAGTAEAEQRALILLGGLEQNLDLFYNHNGQKYESDLGKTSSSAEYFREQYNVSLGYAVYSPYLWKGNILGRLNLSQGIFSGEQIPSHRKSDVGVQYAIDGNLLERQPISFSFFSRAETAHVNRTFSPGYDLDTDNNGVGVVLKNRFLPLSFSYSRNNSETQGLPNDTNLLNEVISLKANNSFKEISQTDLELIHSHNESEVKGVGPLGSFRDEGTLYSFLLKNRLLSPDKRHTLDSSLMRREDDHRGQNNSLYWQETFTSALGKALTLGLAYGTTNSTITYETAGSTLRSSAKTQSGDLNLTHRLFHSLVSQFSLSASSSEFSTGNERTEAGKAGFNYLKTLPEESSLNLYYTESLGVTDRDVTTELGIAVDEAITVRMLGQTLLKHPNVQVESVVVAAADPAVRLRPYVRGVDYEIIIQGAYLRLDFNLMGSEITDGAQLVVTYTYLVNPSSRYRTSARAFGGNVSLYGRRAVIYGSFSHVGQKLLSGSEEVVPLTRSTSIVGGVSSELDGLFSSIEYSYLASSYGTNQSVQGLVRLDREVNRYLVGIRLRDSWSLYGNGPGNPRERSENILELGSTLRGAIYDSALLTVGATYINFHNDNFTRDDIRFDFTVRATYGRLVLLMSGKTAWRFYAGTTARDDAFTLQATRYF